VRGRTDERESERGGALSYHEKRLERVLYYYSLAFPLLYWKACVVSSEWTGGGFIILSCVACDELLIIYSQVQAREREDNNNVFTPCLHPMSVFCPCLSIPPHSTSRERMYVCATQAQTTSPQHSATMIRASNKVGIINKHGACNTSTNNCMHASSEGRKKERKIIYPPLQYCTALHCTALHWNLPGGWS